MQIYTKAFISLSVLLSINAFSQEKLIDTTKTRNIDEIVVTGQFEPQSIKKSVFNVRVISSQDIQNLAVNNLGDVLNQYLNITVKPNGANGRSTVSMFGLDAFYFKILVDNVPLVNEAGFGNNVDLSQINLNDVERIEIIEGSMGVTHGANAVSGVLNIITKKSSIHKWSIMASAQEETVNTEFSLFDQGRHIQALKVSHNINDNWFVSLGANRNDFKGYLGDKQGKGYFENDGLRGYSSWLPKEQIISNALIAYQKNDFRMFYKFEYLDENTDYYNSTVQSGFSPELGSYRYADDKRYYTERFYHHLNASGKVFSQLNYNVSVSHQKQSRSVEDFNYFMLTGAETENVEVKDQSMEVIYSTGTLSNFFKNSIVDLQVGYEIVNNKGFSLVEEENRIMAPVRKTLENYDFFTSAEVKATEKFYIRPGIRVSSQSKFEDQYASSLGLRYIFDGGLELRGSLGKSFRTPTFEELYSKQIFDGHHFTGNENLVPETSTSYEIGIKKAIAFNSGLTLASTLTGSYLDVNDRIDMAFIRINESNTPEYEYINISDYKMWNFSTTHQLKKDNWMFNVGAAFVGISQKIENQVFSSDDKFLYSYNLNSSVSYSIPKWNSVFSAYYKYNGKTQQFIEASSEYVISEIEATNWLDASFRKSFFANKFDVTLGARNLLDVDNVRQTRTGEGAGHAGSSTQNLAYGRSYYLKLTYNLNF